MNILIKGYHHTQKLRESPFYYSRVLILHMSFTLFDTYVKKKKSSSHWDTLECTNDERA